MAALPPATRFDATSYYKKLTRVFRELPDEGTRRAYVAAVRQCFDVKQGSPEFAGSVAANHGFKVNKLHEYGFALAKSHAEKFFVVEAGIPGVSVRDVRAITSDTYRDAFERHPHVRGRSTYWFTPAEWIVLLEVPGQLPLPTQLKEFAGRSNLLE